MATKLVRLRNDKRSIHEAAKTLSLAFSNDPLIKWLRPGARPWSDLDESSMKWQRRRVQRYNCDNAVFYLEPHSETSAKENILSNYTDDSLQEAGSIAMIELPKMYKKVSLMNFVLQLKMFALDLLDPCDNAGGSEKRIDIMMGAHTEALEEIRAKLQTQDLMYIEVIAIHPSQQGQGLGRKLMNAIVDMAGKTPIVLECTDRANIVFYTRFGFQVVKEITLEDSMHPSEKVVLFVMVRE